MESWIVSHEALLRAAIFFGVLLALMFLETLVPRRALRLPRLMRWPNNLGLVIFDTLLLRILFPTAAAGFAAWCTAGNIGLFHSIAWALGIEILLCLILLDLAIYTQHVVFHKVPWLWRLHKVHHADLDYDVTTGSRFHPIEILLSMLIKFAVIALLGVPVVAVILFEVILNAMAMFNHSNIRLPDRLDSVLRKLLVTPDMHRVHHSRLYDEANRNFGFNLSLWDKLFRTYQEQPQQGQDGVVFGLKGYDDPKQVVSLLGLLLLPLRKT